MDLNDVAEVEEVSEPEFTHLADNASLPVSGFFQCFGGITIEFIKKQIFRIRPCPI